MNIKTSKPNALYMSPYDFNALKNMGEILFEIEILVAFQLGNEKMFYIDSQNQSDEFIELNRKATIPQIIEVLQKNNLLVREYSFKNDVARLQSVNGDDLLMETAGESISRIDFFNKSFEHWEIDNSIFYKNDKSVEQIAELFQPGRLIDLSKEGNISISKFIPNLMYLVCYLLCEQQTDLIANRKFETKRRFYFD